MSAPHLEDELRAVALSGGPNERNAEIFLRRYGWDGSGGATLEAIGENLGVTRERVRQVCMGLGKRILGASVETRILRRCVEFVAEAVPGMADEVQHRLHSEGLTRGRFQLEGLCDAANRLGITSSFEIVAFRGRRFALPIGHPELPADVFRLAASSCSHWGVATLADVAARATNGAAPAVSPEFVLDVIRDNGGFSVLDDSGWFWRLPIESNPLVHIIEKVIAVAHHLRLGELRRAVGRSMNMGGFSPPTRVLRRICENIPRCRIEGDFVVDNGLPKWVTLLALNEATVVLAAKQLGPLATRDAIQKRCKELGVNANTASIYLSYSPAIARYAQSVYGAVGATFEPGAAEALVPQTRSRVLVDFGWKDSKPWLAFRISLGLLNSGVFSIPIAMKRFLVGEFTLRTPDGAQVGKITLRNSQGWGLLPLFRRRGGEPDDVLVLEFLPESAIVVAHLGDETLLDEFEPEDPVDLKP